MAINRPTQMGSVSGNFWRASGIYISPDYSHSRVQMQLYKDQAAYVSGDTPIYGNDFLITDGPFNLINLSAISDADLLADNAQFSGGTYVSGV